MASQIIIRQCLTLKGPAEAVVSFHSAELFVFKNKTVSSLKSIVDSARNRRRAEFDLLIKFFKHHNISHGAHQQPRNDKSNNYSATPHPYGSAKATVYEVRPCTSPLRFTQLFKFIPDEFVDFVR